MRAASRGMRRATGLWRSLCSRRRSFPRCNVQVKIRAQVFACLHDRVRNVQIVAVKAFGEPLVPARVVVKKKDTNRTTGCLNAGEAESV